MNDDTIFSANTRPEKFTSDKDSLETIVISYFQVFNVIGYGFWSAINGENFCEPKTEGMSSA